MGRIFTLNFRSVDPIARLGQQSYPVVVGDRMYVTTGEGKTYARRRDDRQGDLEVVPGADRRLQQGGHRGQPRRRGLRREGVRPEHRHDDHDAQPADGRRDQARTDLQRRPGCRDALRLLRDERADLRQTPRDHRRSRLRVRRARLRHGVQDERPLAGVGEPGLVDPALRDELAQGQPDRRRRRDVDAGHDRHEDEHGLLRHRLGDAAVLPRVAAGVGSAHRLADRRRSAHREAEVVAAADGAQRMVVRHGAAAARVRRQGRRQEAARRLGRDDGRRLVLLRRSDRAADLSARQGDRPHRASAAAAGQAGRRVPGLDRRAQLLARGVRPEDELHLQRGGGDGVA